jgi:hypothetical protein
MQKARRIAPAGFVKNPVQAFKFRLADPPARSSREDGGDDDDGCGSAFG